MVLGSPWEHLPERSCEHEGPAKGSDVIKAVQLLCSLKGWGAYRHNKTRSLGYHFTIHTALWRAGEPALNGRVRRVHWPQFRTLLLPFGPWAAAQALLLCSHTASPSSSSFSCSPSSPKPECSGSLRILLKVWGPEMSISTNLSLEGTSSHLTSCCFVVISCSLCFPSPHQF